MQFQGIGLVWFGWIKARFHRFPNVKLIKGK